MKAQITTSVLVAFSLGVFAQKLELVIPIGHTRQVQDIAISEDTLYLASIQNSNEIVLWDYPRERQLRVLRNHKSRVNDLEAADGRLWSSSDDGRVMSWNFNEQELSYELDHGSSVLASKVLDSELISIGRKGTIKVWKLADQSLVKEVRMSEDITAVSNIVDDRMLVGMADGTVKVLEVPGLTEVNGTDTGAQITALAIGSSHFHLGAITGELISYSRPDFQEVNRQKVLGARIYGLAMAQERLWIAGRGESNSLAVLNPGDFSVSIPDLPLPGLDKLAEAGIRTIIFHQGNDLVIIPDAENALNAFGLASRKLLKRFEGLAFSVEDFALSNDESLLAVASGQEKIKLYDLELGRTTTTLEGHQGGVTSVTFHPSDSLLASVGRDGSLRIWSVNTGRNTHTYEVRGKYRNTAIEFDRTGEYIIRKADDKYFELFKLDKSKSKRLNVENGLSYKFAQNGEKLLFQTRDGIAIYNSVTLKEERAYPLKGIKDFDVAGNTIVTVGTFGMRVFNLNFSDLGQFPDIERVDRIYLHPEEGYALGTVNTTRKGSSERDYAIKRFDLETGALMASVEVHQGFISRIGFLKGGRFTLTGASDGQIHIFKGLEGESPIGTMISLGDDDWVATTPGGLYDATSAAFGAMHYMRGDQQIALNQLKDVYFEPQLVPRLLENIDDPLPQRKAINDVLPHPEIQITHPNLNDGVVGMNLSDQGGGIGRIVILINGKEVIRETGSSRNLEGNVALDYAIEGHPFLKPNTVNKISIKAYNQYGTLATPEENLYYFAEQTTESEEEPPKLYALVVGSGDYPGRSLDLNYAVKDAIDFSSALSASSSNLFGAENTITKLLHTDYADTLQWPSKRNIENTLSDFAQQATARDYLLLYFSGHGMNYGEDREDFYYLTPFATDAIEDDAIRAEHMVSSIELTEWIKEIAALKQVLIFDACHSGRLANQIGTGSGALTSGQVKAMEELKDRTGLYVIAGSEADAVSYETAMYEQGLLTYSLLFGMKGAALNTAGEVDIIDLLQFVSKKVPELASEIGGVQLPEVRVPAGAESFSIGRLSPEDRDRIQLAGSKPVIIHSGFQEESQFYDIIQLGTLVDDLLIEASAQNDAQVIFLDKKQFGSAFQVRGRYRTEGELWKARVRVFQDENQVASFDVEAVNPIELSEKISARAIEVIGR